MVWGSAQDTQVPQTVVCFCPSKSSPAEEQAVFPRPAEKNCSGKNKGGFLSQVHFKAGVPDIGYSVPYPSPSDVVPSMAYGVGPLESSHESV